MISKEGYWLIGYQLIGDQLLVNGY